MIARDTKSYPYLALAQAHDLHYGTVLLYADAWKKISTRLEYNEHEKLAIKAMAAVDRERGSNFQRQIMDLSDSLK